MQKDALFVILLFFFLSGYHVTPRERKIHFTFTRSRDNFEFRDHIPSHNPSYTVNRLYFYMPFQNA